MSNPQVRPQAEEEPALIEAAREAANEVLEAATEVERYIEKGTPQFMRTSLALFSGGFATFALLYCIQPMMPVLSKRFPSAPRKAAWHCPSPPPCSPWPAGHRPDLRRDRSQSGDGRLAAGRRAVHPRQRGDAHLAWRAADARAGRAVLERPGRGGDDLSQRRDPSAAHRPVDGPVHRRQRHRRDERTPDQRRPGRFHLLACRTGGPRRPGPGRRAGVLARAARIETLPAGTAEAGDPAQRLPPALPRRRTALAVPDRLPADGQLRHPVQLHRLPPAGRALPHEPGGGRRALGGLPLGHLQLGLGRFAGRQAGATQGALGGHPADARRPAADPVRADPADARRPAAIHLGFFGAHSVASSWIGRRACAPRARPRRSTCSATTSARAWPAPSAGCSGITTAGTASGCSSARCWWSRYWSRCTWRACRPCLATPWRRPPTEFEVPVSRRLHSDQKRTPVSSSDRAHSRAASPRSRAFRGIRAAAG